MVTIITMMTIKEDYCSFEVSKLLKEKGFNWPNAHHFDYRGLISMGLAIEAPEGMYK